MIRLKTNIRQLHTFHAPITHRERSIFILILSRPRARGLQTAERGWLYRGCGSNYACGVEKACVRARARACMRLGSDGEGQGRARSVGEGLAAADGPGRPGVARE